MVRILGSTIAGRFQQNKTNNKSSSSQQNQQLQRENIALRKKLEQAEAIIDLQKKISNLLGLSSLELENSEKD